MTRSRHNPIDRILGDIESRRRKYAGALTAANRAILDGIEQLAEHERSAIKVHYKQAQTGLRSFKQSGSPRDLALTQAELLQNTATRILANTRQSFTILDNTRRAASSRVRTHLSNPGAYRPCEEAGTAEQARPTPAPRPSPEADIAAQETSSTTSSRPTARESAHSAQGDKAQSVSPAAPEDAKPAVNETVGDAKAATKKEASSSPSRSGTSRESDPEPSPSSSAPSGSKTTPRRAGSRKTRSARETKTSAGEATGPTQPDNAADSKSSPSSQTAGDKNQSNDDHHSAPQ